MKKAVYIFENATLKREENTLLLLQEGKKRFLPIHAISQIHVFGELDLNKRVLQLLTQAKIPVHFYNYYGYYVGSYHPRFAFNSGLLTLQQARCYLQEDERLYLARSFVVGAVKNMLKNIAYYKKQTSALQGVMEEMERLLESVHGAQDVAQLMAFEASVRRAYYEAFGYIIQNEEFVFEKRTKRPPKNPLNALISFGNSLLYTTALSEIYRTHLDPRIGFLHETNQRSFSLNLDIAEIFKPIIVDRIIFSLINKQMIALKHFDKDVGYSYLNQKGQKIFIKAFEEKLATTISYKNLGKVSYRRLLRLECYKLYKHFLLEDLYKPFIARW